MLPALTIDPEKGTLSISGCALSLSRKLPRDEVLEGLSPYYSESLDHYNGYQWLSFEHVSFGGQPCGFSVCFHNDALEAVHFGVSLPNDELESGWPTLATIHNQVAFMRTELKKQLRRTLVDGSLTFAWGVVWCRYDQRGFMASAGLRYTP